MSSKLLAIVLMAASVAPAAIAQDSTVPVQNSTALVINQRTIHRVERRFNITSEQIEQARTILQQERPKLMQIRQSLVAERKEMATASSSGSFDPAVAQSIVAKYADVNADGIVEHAKLHAELIAILTPEQQQKLQQLRARIAAAFPMLADAIGNTQ